jgi:hypothetical protein
MKFLKRRDITFMDTEEISNLSKLLLLFIKFFPELKGWLKEQFNLNIIKRVIKKLDELSRYEYFNENERTEIKNTIKNLIATFNIDEYFIKLFA